MLRIALRHAYVTLLLPGCLVIVALPSTEAPALLRLTQWTVIAYDNGPSRKRTVGLTNVNVGYNNAQSVVRFKSKGTQVQRHWPLPSGKINAANSSVNDLAHKAQPDCHRWQSQ